LRFPFLVIESLALGFNPVKSRTLLAPGLCQCCLQYLERRDFNHPEDLADDVAIELIADEMRTRFRLPGTAVTGTLVPMIIDAEQLIAQLTAEESLQKRRPAARTIASNEVIIGQYELNLFLLLHSHVCRVVVGNSHPTMLGNLDATRLARC
jgi:hypothetical protein